PVTTTSVADDIYFHAPFGASVTNVDLATQIPELKYCNSNGFTLCKRNGADSAGANLVSGTAFDSASSSSGNAMPAGQFPYRTNPAHASTAIFGLPEMMSIGSFTRSGTVTVTTVEAHGVAPNDRVFVTGTGTMDGNAFLVSAATANTFAYTGGSGTGPTNGSYRKHSAATFAQSGSLVTVTSTAHGLVTSDVIAAASVGATDTGRSVTVLTANTFTFTSGGTHSGTFTWVRTGLYNVASSVTGPPNAYAVVPVEYCSDGNLTNCAYVLPGNTPPAGFTFPAYVRFCQTQAQALAPGAVSDSSGTPRCRSKYNETASITQYLYARHGWFKRDIIKATVGSYTNRP